MTEQGQKIHAYWYTLVAMKVVLEGMSSAKAEREALNIIIEEYGEDTLRKEFKL